MQLPTEIYEYFSPFLSPHEISQLRIVHSSLRGLPYTRLTITETNIKHYRVDESLVSELTLVNEPLTNTAFINLDILTCYIDLSESYIVIRLIRLLIQNPQLRELHIRYVKEYIDDDETDAVLDNRVEPKLALSLANTINRLTLARATFKFHVPLIRQHIDLILHRLHSLHIVGLDYVGLTGITTLTSLYVDMDGVNHRDDYMTLLHQVINNNPLTDLTIVYNVDLTPVINTSRAPGLTSLGLITQADMRLDYTRMPNLTTLSTTLVHDATHLTDLTDLTIHTTTHEMDELDVIILLQRLIRLTLFMQDWTDEVWDILAMSSVTQLTLCIVDPEFTIYPTRVTNLTLILIRDIVCVNLSTIQRLHLQEYNPRYQPDLTAVDLYNYTLDGQRDFIVTLKGDNSGLTELTTTNKVIVRN